MICFRISLEYFVLHYQRLYSLCIDMNKHTTLLITTAIVGGLTTSSCEKEQYIIPDSKKNLTPSTVIITPDTVQKPYDNHPNYENTYEELLKILDPTSKSFTKNASQTTDTTMEKKATINKSIPSKTNQSKKNIIEKIWSIFQD